MRRINATIALLLVLGLVPSSGSPTAAADGGALVFFTADDGIHGRELWKSDGTEAGSVMVRDLRPGSRGSAPTLLAVIDGRVFFGANDGSHGSRMWTSDGTEAGTGMIEGSPAPLPESYAGGGSAVVRGSLYFTTYRYSRVWVSDGTTIGTRPLHIEGECLASAGRLTYFVHNYTTEIWRTDATKAGTFMVQRLRRPSALSECPSFTDMDGTVIYDGRSVRQGHEPWKSDGTVAGTTLVSDIAPGPESSYPSTFAGLDERALFRTLYPPFMWVTDGTSVGTTKLHRFVHDVYSLGGDPAVGGSFYFEAVAGGAGYELWESDGTPEGTRMVKDINPGNAGSGPLGAAPLDGDLYFTADDGQHGAELWRSDGTEAGTMMLSDIIPGSEGSFPDHLVSSGGFVFFTASDGVHGTELWRTDGTASGTVMIKDINPGSAATNGSITYLCASPSSASCHELR